MTEDQDNAGEVVAGAVRVALTAAGQLAEQAARRREADLRAAERDSAARAATLQSQLAVERELALRSVRDVVQRGDAANVDDVVRAWEQARSWDDPSMATEQARLEDRIRERFGVDASARVADRASGEQVTATTLVARDVELQADEVHQRGAVRTQHAEVDGELIVHEVATARALALESHPTPAAWAARQPITTTVGKPRGMRRVRAVEVQGPGNSRS